MYVLPEGAVVDVQPSELLREKLLEEANGSEHQAANAACDWLLKEKDRLEKLQEATHKYIEMREKLVSNELRRTMHRRYDGSELASLLASLEQKKEGDLRQLQQRAEQASNSGQRVDTDKEKMRIEE